MSTCTEDELRSSFVSLADSKLWSRYAAETTRAVMESECSAGRADWVWAAASGHWPPAAVADLIHRPSHARFLACLKSRAPRSEAFLRTRLQISPAAMRPVVRLLLDAGLIQEPAAKCYVLGPTFAEPRAEVTAFEFKLHNWRRALYQAIRYRAFAHRVFVVVPATTVPSVLPHADTFCRFRVGVLSWDMETGRGERIFAASKSEPASRSAYLRALSELTAWAT